ncbi:MAG TPA: glycosyltransferase family 2 protein [Acidimicrobiales bacterium]|jgi:glycosyltransferase involved in cell wall biosynthesis
MPAHNERDYLEAAVAHVVAGLQARRMDFEVVVCENGSTDRTVELGEALEKRYPEVRLLTNPQADYGRALRQGFLAAEGDVVVNFDVDYVDLDFLEAALDLMRGDGGPSVVVASKRGAGSEDTRPLGRRAVTAVFSFVLRTGFGLTVTDTHGMKALRRADLAGLVDACQCGEDLFDTELILRAERAGLRVAELPVTVRDTRPPRSSIVSRIPRSVTGLIVLRRALRHQARSSRTLAA